MPSTEGVKSFSDQRKELHRKLAEELLHFVRGEDDVPATNSGYPIASNADKANITSVKLAERLARQMEPVCGILRITAKLDGNTYGSKFERAISDFVREAFSCLNHIRPGQWTVKKVTSRDDRLSIAEYEQYAYLKVIDEFAKKSPELDAALGTDYFVTSDIVVIRDRLTDAEINRDAAGHDFALVDETVAKRSRLRASAVADAADLTDAADPHRSQLLHASISCKWTIRSDRAQNTRLEARNLSSSRKGNQPHIVAVTAEPLPSRLAAIALSTGDIDCVYHIALDELLEAFEHLVRELTERLEGLRTKTARVRARGEELAEIKQSMRRLRAEKQTLNLNKLQAEYKIEIERIRAGEKALRERKTACEAGLDQAALKQARKDTSSIEKQIDQLRAERKWLDKMVRGNRLRDISDLPLDLAV